MTMGVKPLCFLDECSEFHYFHSSFHIVVRQLGVLNTILICIVYPVLPCFSYY